MRYRTFLTLVLPVTLVGCAGPDTASRQTDVAALQAAHETVLQAHRDGDVERWLGVESDSYVVANRGRVTFPTMEERRAAREPYLANTRFSRYEDVSEPFVTISDDGSLGWLIAEVAVTGRQTLPDGSVEAVESVYAWIELYRRVDGEWRLVGNVSNSRPRGSAPRVRQEDRMIEGPAGDLFVTDGGSGGLPVVIIHSAAGSTEQWHEQLDHLRATRRTVAYDVRGHGRSARSADRASFRIPALAGDVEAVVDELALDRFVLVGHSMGASLALEYAARHPDRVAGLVLVDGAFHRQGDLEPGTAEFLEALEGPQYPALIEQYWDQILIGGGSAVAERVKADLRSTPQATVLGVMHGILDYDHPAAARAYPGPIYLVLSPIGNDDTALHHYAEVAETVLLEDTAHWLHLDRPERFARILDRLLAEIK